MQFYSNVKVYNNVKCLPKCARIICVFVSCVSHVFVSVHCCFVVTCCERAYLFALVDDVYCNLLTFPCGILDQVRYLIVSFPDLCLDFYLYNNVQG